MTGNGSVAVIDKGRIFLRADGLLKGAARMKTAAGGQMNGAGEVAL